MPTNSPFRGKFSQPSFITQFIRFRSRLTWGIVAICVVATACSAQQPSSTAAQTQAQPGTPQGPNLVVVPAGTRMALVLMQPIRSRSMHRGDPVYAQVTSPVAVGEQLVIPPGTSIEGRVEKAEGRGGRGELSLQSASVIFLNGYVARVLGPVEMDSADGYAVGDVGKGRMIGAFVLPTAGMGLGALIGHSVSHATSTTLSTTLPPNCGVPVPGCSTPSTQTFTMPTGDRLQGTAIGSGVGLAVGGIGSLVLFSGSRHFFLDVGSPMEMVLRQSLILDTNRVADALAHARPEVQPIVPMATIAAQPSFDCSGGQQWCGGSCRNTISFMNDSSNCGRCGNRCSFGETCSGGSCGCGPGSTSCMGSCVSDASFFSDTSNCGRCGNHCSVGESCTGGTCRKVMP